MVTWCSRTLLLSLLLLFVLLLFPPKKKKSEGKTLSLCFSAGRNSEAIGLHCLYLHPHHHQCPKIYGAILYLEGSHVNFIVSILNRQRKRSFCACVDLLNP